MELLKVTIVIPCYNEEESIGDDVEAIRKAMEPTGYDYEILVVNDGSMDRTEAIAKEPDSGTEVRRNGMIENLGTSTPFFQ